MVLLQGEEEKEGETTFLQQFRYTHNGHHPAKEIPVPDYTTLCRRRRKIVIPKVNLRKGGPSLVVDSTGIKTVGAGEWREVIERGRKRRRIYQELEEIGARICHYFGKGPPKNYFNKSMAWVRKATDYAFCKLNSSCKKAKTFYKKMSIIFLNKLCNKTALVNKSILNLIYIPPFIAYWPTLWVVIKIKASKIKSCDLKPSFVVFMAYLFLVFC